MLALEDLVDLGDALRRAGARVSTQQLLATQSLLLRLAAEGALPATRSALASWIAPVLCISAAEQDAFDARYRNWLHQRFGDAAPSPTTPPPSPPPLKLHPWPHVPVLLVAALIGAIATWLVVSNLLDTPQRQTPTTTNTPAADAPAPPSAASSTAVGLQFVNRFDFAADAPPPTLRERINGRNLGLFFVPLALYATWLLRWLLRRPVLRRMSSRTPSQLSEVHVPGAVRALLPSLPLRRLAQELRRRRNVASSELQMEPSVRATLARGGVFTPVRGSRVEPDYLVLIDRSGLSDHQARLATEIAEELGRSDVLIDRYEFNRDARVVLSRGAGATQSVELAELHERHPEHRVLIFGDGSGCFDSATGAPTAWTLTLASWPLPVLLTPLPPERWGRCEWRLQRLGIQVLPLDAQGLRSLMGVMAMMQFSPFGAEPPAGTAPRAYERSPRRWLERHTPDSDNIDRVVKDLHAELGPLGVAWLAACAAYPQVHWGITLRLGKALVPNARQFEQLLPRIARLVWFREAYLPDWLRERLLEELSPAEEALARTTLRAMLEIIARGGTDVPLVIAQGEPTTAKTWLHRLRRWWQARGDAKRAQELLRAAERDSPLRDHVFLRFLSGENRRRIDLRAPRTLLAALSRVPAVGPLLLASLAAITSAGLAMGWPPVHLGEASVFLTDMRFTRDSRDLIFGTQVALQASGRSPQAPVRSIGLDVSTSEEGWRPGHEDGMRGNWRVVSPGGDVIVFECNGGLCAASPTMQVLGAQEELQSQPPRPLQGDGRPQSPARASFSRDGSRFAMLDERMARVWSTVDGRLLKAAYTVGTPFAIDLDADGRQLATITAPDSIPFVWAVGDDSSPGLQIPSGPPARIVRFTPDGKRLAVVRGGSLELYDSVTGQLNFANQVSERATFLLFSPDSGLYVAWGGGARPVVGLTSNVPRNWGLLNSGEQADIAFSPDGRRIATIDATGTVKIWDASTGEEFGSQPHAKVPCCERPHLSFSPDGLWLASAVGTELTIWRTNRPSVPPPAATAVPAGPPAPISAPGNIAWLVLATLLTALMVPALALFSRGLTNRNAAGAAVPQLAVTAVITGLLWLAFGYSVAYTAGNGFIGGLDRAFFSGLLGTVSGHMPTMATFSKGVVIPELLFALFEGAVAAFAACLVVAGLVGLVRWRSLLAFAMVWLVLAYLPILHMVWYWEGPDAYTSNAVVDPLNAKAGIAWRWGVLDFAGGSVVVINAAVAGLVGLLYRRGAKLEESVAHASPALMVLAVALLWIGAVGWVAGSGLEANGIAALATACVLWTPATALIARPVVETFARGHTSTAGVAWGGLAGLAASASAAGNVGVVGAVVIGLLAGTLPIPITVLVKGRFGADKALDYFVALGGGALVGLLATGFFNNQAAGGPGVISDWVAMATGSVDFGRQFLVQGKGALLTVAWSAAVSLLACAGISRIWGWRAQPVLGPQGEMGQTTDDFEYSQRPVLVGIAVLCLTLCIGMGAMASRSYLAQSPYLSGTPGTPGAALADGSAAASAASAASATTLPSGAAAKAPDAPTAAESAATAPAAAAAPAPAPLPHDIGWMLFATALLLAAAPGIALFCAGLLRQPSMPAAAARVLAVCALTLVFWFVYGYSFVYTEGNAYIGGLDRLLLKGVFDPQTVTFATAATFRKGVVITELLFIAYEGLAVVFATSLMAAALGERMHTSALLAFILAWLTFAYAPIAHMSLFWLGPDAYTAKEVVDAMNAKAGWIWQLGALDNAGGFSLAVAASVAGLVCALISAPAPGERRITPPSTLAMAAGAALLWLAGYGLHGGAALEWGSFTMLAAATHFILPATAALAWGLAELMISGRMTLRGLSIGAVAGMLTTTTVAGNVGMIGAFVIGAAAGLLGHLTHAGFSRRRLQDDVRSFFAALLAATSAGALLTGVFNSQQFGGPGAVGDWVTADLISIDLYSITAQIFIQAKALMVTVAWSATVSYVAYKLIDLLLGATRRAETGKVPV
ncbi:MAG: hypothetical protein JF607_05025 [Burkholderiales bacterium]|jgi:Amt family ammonium transporter|nr:hypothetical protein [Burkholderiales bacterium]